MPPIAPALEARPEAEAPSLLARIDRTRLPLHVAVIMDGNGRWAESRRLDRLAGHTAGVESVRDIVEAAAGLGLSTLTLFAFSLENWRRPAEEVEALMELVKTYLQLEAANLISNSIRFRAIGRVDELPRDVREMVEETAAASAHCAGLSLNVALNYGGRAEIVDAARAFAARALEEGRVPELDEAGFAAHLTTASLPDPDLLIRTSGEMRLSNFLLFQTAYTEFWSTETLWPDFRRRHFYEAILDFQRRIRRYGGLG